MGIAMFIWLRGILYERAANKCLEREREREREAYVRLRKTRYVCEWERERERERCDVMCWLCCAVVNYNNVLWLEYWRSIGVLQSHPCTQDRLCICVRLEASANRMDWAWQQLKFIQKEFYLRAHLYLPLARLYLYRCCCCCCRRCCRRRYWRRHCCSYKAVVVLLLPMMLSRFIHSCRFGDRF